MPYAASRPNYRGRPLGPRHVQYPPKTKHDLTRNLFALLHDLGHTMQAISAACGYPIDTLRRWRNGYSRPRVIDLENVAGCFGLRLGVDVLPMAAVAPGRVSGNDWTCRAASRVTRQFFQLLHDWQLSPAAVATSIGRAPETFSIWSRGVRSPYINEMESAVYALGCRLIWEPQSQRSSTGTVLVAQS